MNLSDIERLRENLHLFVDAYVDSFQAVVETSQLLFERIAKAYEVFKTQYIYLLVKYYEKKEHIESIRSGWNVKNDTRRMSQVLDRRPKVIVRKVI